MNKYKGYIKCGECQQSFKGRKERNKIVYRCNNRLKNGKDKCINDVSVEEDYITKLITMQLDNINMNIENVDVPSILDKIIVSKYRIEIFFKNLPINCCYFDSKKGQLHFDSTNN